jgi:hypothetical protein
MRRVLKLQAGRAFPPMALAQLARFALDVVRVTATHARRLELRLNADTNTFTWPSFG